jgi:hypothetical protein
MIELQETEKSAWVDVQFLKQAVDQVLSYLLLLSSPPPPRPPRH